MTDYTKWKGKVTQNMRDSVFVLPAQDSQFSLGTDTIAEPAHGRGLYLSLTSQSVPAHDDDVKVLMSKRPSDLSYLAQDVQVIKPAKVSTHQTEDLSQISQLRQSSAKGLGQASSRSVVRSTGKVSLRASQPESKTSHIQDTGPQASAQASAQVVAKSTTNGELRPKKFMITFGPKKNHIWAAINDSDNSIYINGANGPVLRVHRGMTYYFCVDGGAEKNTFMLSPYPMVATSGGELCLLDKTLQPISEGVLVLRVTEKTPKYFYYLSTSIANAGGLIMVVEEEKKI